MLVSATTFTAPTAALHQQEESLYSALISLNNSSIAILERGERRICIDTFKDALRILKSPNDLSYVATALELAERRIAEAEQSTGSDLGVVVLSSQHDPAQAYNLLTNLRTSKVCLTMDPNGTTLDLQLVRSILVYNYGIAHRCCGEPGQTTPNGGNLGSFCLQIFQYAETLLPAGITSNLLYRLVLTRNLMMLSCKLGMSLCEHYKETLDPIVADILGPLEPEGDQHGTPAA
jgi:hypothetical protein